MSEEWNMTIKTKLRRETRLKIKKGSISQRNILMETTKPGQKSKKEARDPECYRESKGLQVQAVE